MQLLHGITALTFRLKFFKLLFLIALSATILTGCERQIVSPIKDVPDSPQIDTQLAQNALSDLADTAASQGLLNLAAAATEFVEALATEDQTSVQPTFSKLSRLASEVTYLIYLFDYASSCTVELTPFAEATLDAIKAYTIRNAAEMNHALQELAQEARTANMTLQSLSDLITLNNSFKPFVFGYRMRIWPARPTNLRVLGKMALTYQNIDIGNETDAAVIDFLATKGYKAIRSHGYSGGDCSYPFVIDLGAQVDIRLIKIEFAEELYNIPNLARIETVETCPFAEPAIVPPLYVDELNKLITNAIAYRYNRAWCVGNLDLNTIDNILFEESKLDFLNYAFLRRLADIFIEEKPQVTEFIGSNVSSLFRSILLEFLRLYFQNSGKTDNELVEMYPKYNLWSRTPVPEGFDENSFRSPEKTIDEIIEIFRQSVRNGNVDITADKAPDSYYYYYYDYLGLRHF